MTTGTETFDPGSGAGGGGVICETTPGSDMDMDGWTPAEGDCNDCDENVNPGAIEVPTDPNDPEANPADENCNDETDEVAQPCDQGIQIGDADPNNGAKAIGLCTTATANGKTPGVISALYVRANGAVANPGVSVGVQQNFGANVATREGGSMLVLSSGTARLPGQPGACGANTCSTLGAGQAPPGFPQDVPSCSGSSDINDDVALEVQLRAPSNATGYSFDFDFYSFEYPEWVCTSFNDQFIALVDPAPMGSINGNISFDSMNNPVSVNIAFFDVCSGCPLGTAELSGNGFDGGWGDDAGATSWLVTTAPITGNDVFKVRFAVWDTGDSAWDSTVLIDNFKWIASAGTVTVGTVPIPK